MKISQILCNTAVLISCLSGIALAQLPKIDGFITDTKATAESNRAIYVKPDSFGESTLIVGTNKGKAMYAKIQTNSASFKPVFKPFSFAQSPSGLVKDIYFFSNTGYLLRTDGIYTTDGKSPIWKPLVNIKDLPQEEGSTAELWGISFIDNLRACIVGTYFKDNSDDIDTELLLCTDNINDRTKWKKPVKPKNVKTQQLQLTNIYFDREKMRGWAVGTNGVEGIIWYSEDGGEKWEELKTTSPEPLLGVFGMNEKSVAVGLTGMIFGKGFGGDSISETIVVKTISNSEIYEGDTVEIQKEFLSKISGIGQALPIVTGLVEEIREDGMLKIGNIEVATNFDVIRKLVKKHFEKNNYVERKNVKKIKSGKNSKNSNNNNNANNNDTNASADWKTIKSPLKTPLPNLRSVKFADNGLDGFIVGDRGTIIYTQNGGQNWKVLPAAQIVGIDLYSIFIDENYAWIVGNKGAVVRIKYK